MRLQNAPVASHFAVLASGKIENVICPIRLRYGMRSNGIGNQHQSLAPDVPQDLFCGARPAPPRTLLPSFRLGGLLRSRLGARLWFWLLLCDASGPAASTWFAVRAALLLPGWLCICSDKLICSESVCGMLVSEISATHDQPLRRPTLATRMHSCSSTHLHQLRCGRWLG